MKIINNLTPDTFLGDNFSVALGFFDGVHLAHKKILSDTVYFAKENGLKSAVITFKKSPRCYFTPNQNCPALQTLDDRLDMISKTGLDYAFVLDFDKFKTLSAGEYLKDVLIKHFHPKFILTGFNHTFGAKRTGTPGFLKANENLGYKYIEIEKMRESGVLISSTNVKKFIEKGYIKEANMLLGYNFNISGMVQRGMGLARKLGYKTANLFWDDNIVKPPYGVYFGFVEYSGTTYRALINWGVKPTVNRPTVAAANNEGKPVLEAHILGFNKEIYGENIRVYFVSPLREEKKFDTLEALKKAIASDIKCAANLKL